MGITEQHALAGQLVKVGRFHHIIDAALAIHLGIEAGETPPVISKEKQNVWAGFGSQDCGSSNGQRQQDQRKQARDHGTMRNAAHRMSFR